MVNEKYRKPNSVNLIYTCEFKIKHLENKMNLNFQKKRKHKILELKKKLKQAESVSWEKNTENRTKEISSTRASSKLNSRLWWI